MKTKLFLGIFGLVIIGLLIAGCSKPPEELVGEEGADTSTTTTTTTATSTSTTTTEMSTSITTTSTTTTTTPLPSSTNLWIPIPDVTNHSVMLYWDKVYDSDLEYYKIYRSTSPGVSVSSTLVVSLSTEEAVNYELGSGACVFYKYTDDGPDNNGLDSDTTYYYKVMVYNDKGAYSESDEENITTDSPAWFEINSPTTNYLYSLTFTDENNGWAIGNAGTILHSDGISWEVISSPTSKRLNSVFFLSASEGWAVGEDGIILKYNSDWTEISSPTTRELNSVFFLSSNDGWIVGDDAAVYHYDGTSWESYNVANWDYKDVAFSSPGKGWLLCLYCIKEYDAVNDTWLASHFFPSDYYYGDYIYDAFCVSDNDVWVMGGERMYHKTTGDWQNVPFPAAGPYYSVHFISANEGWAAGWNSSARYTNGNWEYVSTNSARIEDIYFHSINKGWAVGEKIWRYK